MLLSGYNSCVSSQQTYQKMVRFCNLTNMMENYKNQVNFSYSRWDNPDNISKLRVVFLKYIGVINISTNCRTESSISRLNGFEIVIRNRFAATSNDFPSRTYKDRQYFWKDFNMIEGGACCHLLARVYTVIWFYFVHTIVYM